VKWTRGTRNDDVVDVRGRRGSAVKLGGGTAASAIGDDRLQKQAGVEVDPETFTHGTSEQRMRWFRRGFDAGRLEACDTFSRGEEP